MIQRRARPSAELQAGDLLHEAQLHDRAGRVVEAEARYRAAIAAAEAARDSVLLSESLRHAAVLAYRRNEGERALALARRSHAAALDSGDAALAARAVNAQAVMALESGELTDARRLFDQALELAAGDPAIVARIEQNQGIIDNIQGNLEQALAHYERSLAAYEAAGDDAGRALTYHNLGMISADRRQWERAGRYFEESLALAHATGDAHLEGLCLLNRAEVLIARQQYDAARAGAEAALAIFDRLDAAVDKADAYRMLGVVFRETGRPVLAESRLGSAREMSAATGSVLSEAEACRELAQLYRELGRNQEALRLLNASYRLFSRLEARHDLRDVHAKVADLESTYLQVVRDWGQSIESADTYTHGHCSRVADYAVAVSHELQLDDEAITTIRIGAYLHDLGKVRIPHEVLNKPGKLTDDEFALVKMHPVWGLELLEGIEFPWDIKPIIRWHHEKFDGTGYPDRLAGDDIPLAAQIICIVDVYDALTTTRSYRGAMSAGEALERMAEVRQWWRPDVYDAFLGAVARLEAGSAR